MPKCDTLNKLAVSFQTYLRNLNDKTAKAKWENIIKSAVMSVKVENGFGSQYAAEFISGGYPQQPSPMAYTHHYTSSPTGLTKHQQPLRALKLNVEAQSFPGHQ